MLTKDLCDLTDLISGWHEPSNRYGADQGKPQQDWTAEEVEQAIAMVQRLWPAAHWHADASFGRIVAGPKALSTQFAISAPYAEQRAWLSAMARARKLLPPVKKGQQTDRQGT